MPQFWTNSSQRRLLDSRSSSSSLRKSELSGIVLNVRDGKQSREGKVNVLRKNVSSRGENQSTASTPRISPKTSIATYDVVVVGAGPAGLMLATNLIRFGISVHVIDNRPGRTITGRADVLQPKTIETFRQMRLADSLLLKGVKVQDIKFWRSTIGQPLHRVRREIHFPPDQLDTIDPYLLLAHQGFVEDVFLRDMRERDFEVERNLSFVDYNACTGNWPVEVICKDNQNHTKRTIMTKFLIGCDGAHSNVRRAMGVAQLGSSTNGVWGVIDGVLETDFPDLYSKVNMHSEEAGSLLLFPRERNMHRIYVELKPELRGDVSKEELTQEFVMQRAMEIFEPYSLRWKSIEWFGLHQIGRKLASKFQDDIHSGRVFIAGDATHTHSPKSQGMNTSVHDSFNLAWKLNLAIRGLAKPSLLATYDVERRQVAEDLLDYDYEAVTALISGDAEALAEEIQRNVRFTSGFGADYAPNTVNVQRGFVRGELRVGSLPPPGKVMRFVDSNPVDIQVDIPVLGQFRIYFFTKNLQHSSEFLAMLSADALDRNSVLGRATFAANASYNNMPPFAASSDEFIRPERYTCISGLFTFAIVLQMELEELELDDLAPLWRESRWTVYLDCVPEMDTRRMTCTEKWLGQTTGTEVGIVVVRPDGYIGTIYRSPGSKEHASKAIKHLDQYFAGFLDV